MEENLYSIINESQPLTSHLPPFFQLIFPCSNPNLPFLYSCPSYLCPSHHCVLCMCASSVTVGQSPLEAERVKVERLAELISEQKTQLDTCPEALKEQLQNQLSRVSQLPWSPSYLRPPTILLSVSQTLSDVFFPLCNSSGNTFCSCW